MCGLSARLLIPWGCHGVGTKSHQHEHCCSCGAIGWLQSHNRAFPQGPVLPDTGPAPGSLCSPPPKPTTGTEPPPRRGAVSQGRLNTAPASGFLRDKPLLALPGSPHPNQISLSTSSELEAFTGGLGGEDGVRRQGEEPREPGAVQQLWWGYFIKKEKLGFGH